MNWQNSQRVQALFKPTHRIKHSVFSTIHKSGGKIFAIPAKTATQEWLRLSRFKPLKAFNGIKEKSGQRCPSKTVEDDTLVPYIPCFCSMSKHYLILYIVPRSPFPHQPPAMQHVFSIQQKFNSETKYEF